MVDASLVPPDEMLFDGTGTREDFIAQGPGFVWNALIARARLEKHHAVLDIGSGNGKHARVLAEYLEGGTYSGFDIVKEGVKWCQQAYAKFDWVDFKLAEVYSDWYNPDCSIQPNEFKFPYSSNAFDVAFGASLFTHLELDAAENYLRETFRVLKPGGRLYMTCYLITAQNQGIHAQAVQSEIFKSASENHWLLDASSPSRGVAFVETWLRKQLTDIGFKTAEISFGTWSNGIDGLGALQDAVLAIKPL